MSNRSTQIALSAATTGMTLSDPVLDTKGNVLLPEGTMLTTALVASLARHQIDTVGILTDAPSQDDTDAERDRQIGRVERLFRSPGRAKTAAVAAPAMGSQSGSQSGSDSVSEPESMSATDNLHRLILNFRSGMQP